MNDSICHLKKHNDDLFCDCMVEAFGAHVHDFIKHGDILRVFSWACHREGEDANKQLGNIMSAYSKTLKPKKQVR